MSVFGVIVAGRLLQTDFAQAGETQWVTTIADADAVNHVVVFLTGLQPFPDGTGGSVYIRWAQPNGVESPWHCLGFISNQKPSAIFKVAQLKNNTQASQNAALFSGGAFGVGAHGSAQIGVSVEPLAQVEALTPAAGTQPSQQSTLMEFAEKMLRSFVNHAQSFVVKLPRPDSPTLPPSDYIPAAVVENWFTSFRRRLELDPAFWKAIQ